jgi:uncharacterized membrane protein
MGILLLGPFLPEIKKIKFFTKTLVYFLVNQFYTTNIMNSLTLQMKNLCVWNSVKNTHILRLEILLPFMNLSAWKSSLHDSKSQNN